MRILHVNNEKTWRGGERQTLITAVEQRRAGCDSWIACRAGSLLEAQAREAGVPVKHLPVFAPAACLALLRLQSGFDVVHAHTGRAHSLAALAGLVSQRPLVVSRRVDFLPSPTGFNRWKYRRADRTVCVSRFIAAQLESWGVPADRLDVIYEAVPDEGWLSREEARRELRARVPLPEGRPLVGNIAALVPHKDHHTLLRAARALRERRPDAVWVVIGEGELRAELMRLRSGLGLESCVMFAGFMPQAQRLMRAFDVFVLSSNMEGLGTSVLDANLAGVPVAATAGGGLPETVQDGRTGRLVPVGDAAGLGSAVGDLISDPALAARIAGAARERTLAEFSPAHMARRYAELCASLVAPGE
ncbi:MAG: glycosyltransferase family 4 protein [Verrucomicrobiota bacterium]